MLAEQRHSGNSSRSLIPPGTDHQIRVAGKQQRTELVEEYFDEVS